jgi:hypothetical protein
VTNGTFNPSKSNSFNNIFRLDLDWLSFWIWQSRRDLPWRKAEKMCAAIDETELELIDQLPAITIASRPPGDQGR